MRVDGTIHKTAGEDYLRQLNPLEIIQQEEHKLLKGLGLLLAL